MPFVEVAGANIHYEDDYFGPQWKTPEVVFIQHGTGRSTKFWSRLVPRLAERYRVIRRDQRGCGESEQPGPDFVWKLADLADEVAGFFDAVGLDKVHFFGESSGGVLGSAVAVRHPERIRSLAMCASPLDTFPPKDVVIRVGFPDRATAKRELGGEGWTRAMMEVGVISKGPSPEYADWAIREMGKSGPEVMIGMGSVHLPPNELEGDMLPQIGAPTLLLSPAHSPIASLEEQLTMLRLLQDGRMAVINGPGHEIYVDRREDVLREYLTFLENLH